MTLPALIATDRLPRRLHDVRCPSRLGDTRCGRLLTRVAAPAGLRLSGQIDIQLRCAKCKRQYAVTIDGDGPPGLVPLD